MTDLLRAFPFQLLFRGAFAGGFFVMAFLCAMGGRDELLSVINGSDLTALLGAAIFAGVVAYTVFRSLVYPLIEWWLNAVQPKRLSEGWKSWSLISRETCDQLIEHWTVACGGSNDAETNK